MAVDVAAVRLDEAAERALAHDDAWDGFAYHIEKVCELQATEPAIGDVVTGRYPGAARLMAVCDRTQAAAVRVIERAQRAGALRPDFTHEDMLFVFGTNALLARAAKATAPDFWRRGVGFVLDGLRTEAARPLPADPLSPQQLQQVMGNLTSTP
ncbi:TetR/AcrR family transcriptional regulator [Streptomyces sp. NPDC001315]|uniref:SbtR family transcriptional regulator n=1 Tax=Streptomyces sp. NPDC001315 TaxID=3364562 RepID=UPI0036D15B2D